MSEPPTDHDENDDAEQRFSRRALSVVVASFAVGCLGTRQDRAADGRTESVRTTPTPTPTFTSTTTPTSTPPVDSPKVADVLVGLVRADDRAAYAADAGLEYREGRVRVVIELEPGTTPPSDVPLENVVRGADAVEAGVRPDDILRLATDQNVRVVRPPRDSATHETSH